MSDLDEALPRELRAYFEQAVPLVLGQLSDRGDEARARRLEQVLGPSPSGTARLALQRAFVRWQAEHAMRSVFARLKSRLDAVRPGAFDQALQTWIDGHRASCGDPASIGAGFDEQLAADPAVPAWAPELADLLSLRATLRRQAPQHGLVPHAVRFYTHRPHTTEQAPGAWVVWLDAEGELDVVSVGAAEVRALAARCGEPCGATAEDLLAAAPLLGRLASAADRAA
jgi:hypothetical protein